MLWRATALAVALCAILPRGEDGRQAATLTVSAAVSLTDALQAIEPEYRASGGGPVRFNFAGSNVLARQIVNGAPVDLFISADEAQMATVEQAGAVDRATRVDLLGNRLAAVTAKGKGAAVPDVRSLMGPAVRRVAIGDPAAVPAGVYARRYLEAEGVWPALQPRLVPVGNVRAALAAAANGTVDAAIVYESDAGTSSDVDLAFVVTGANAPRIVYPAAVVTASKSRDGAARFLRFLQSAKASAIFAKYRFVPLSALTRR